MDLRDALTQIAEIRAQIARTKVFRGYRAAPVAFSGIAAVAAALVQAAWLPEPVEHTTTYLFLWLGAAVVSLGACGGVMALRHRYLSSPLEREITRLAVEQFVPALAAGALLTIILVATAPETIWMLPGLWQVLFSLGIFASYRLLPRTLLVTAFFYLVTGVLCLLFARDQFALSPWAMGLPFGVGQFLVATILYWNLERNHDEP